MGNCSFASEDPKAEGGFCTSKGVLRMKEEYKEQLIENGVDIKNALRHFMGKEAMYEKYLIKFFQEDPNYEKLLTSLEIQDYAEAFRCVHTLKGVSINLGLIPLYQVLSELTEELRGKTAEEIDAAAVNREKKELMDLYSMFSGIIRESQS